MQHFLTGNRVWGLLTLSLGLLIWFASATFPEVDAGYPDPALFPRVIAMGLLLSGLWLVISQPKGSAEGFTFALVDKGWVRGLILLGLVAGFPFAAEFLGFIPVVGILVLGVGLLFRTRPLVAVITALATSGLIYLVFIRLLNVPL